jgi:predicted nucleic acid-binding protein
MDFADASVVVLAVMQKMDSILSLDADFTLNRLPGKKRIKNPLTDAEYP